MSDLQASLCNLGIITSVNIVQLGTSECDDDGDDDGDGGDEDSDCIGCVG